MELHLYREKCADQWDSAYSAADQLSDSATADSDVTAAASTVSNRYQCRYCCYMYHFAILAST